MIRTKLSKFITIKNTPNSGLEIDSPLAKNKIILNDDNYINEFNSLQDDLVVEIDTPLKNALFDNDLLVEVGRDEDSLIQNHFKYFDEKTIIYTIMPTENCNFRCTYCYEDFPNYSLESKQYDIIYHDILEKISTNEILNVNLSWFGGEPLLETKMVIEFTKKVKELCEEFNAGFSSTITTNGYVLTLPIAKKLIDAGISTFSITLDGYEHDKMRVLKNGKGTFDKIYKNICDILNNELPVNVSVRCNVSANDFDFSFYDKFKQFRENNRLFLYARPVGQWSEARLHHVNTVSAESVFRTLKKHVNYIKKIGLNHFDEFLNAKEFSNVCYASYKNSFVFRANGDIVKCTLNLDDINNKVGKINLTQERIEIFSEANQLWINSELGDKCRKCDKLDKCLNKSCPFNKNKNGLKVFCPNFLDN